MLDVVTGLPNRRAWEAQLTPRIEAMRTAGREGCLAIVDLDHFKQINDRYGHAVGDAVIAAFSQTICEETSEKMVAGRIGGEDRQGRGE